MLDPKLSQIWLACCFLVIVVAPRWDQVWGCEWWATVKPGEPSSDLIWSMKLAPPLRLGERYHRPCDMDSFTWASEQPGRWVAQEQPSTEGKDDDRMSSSKLGCPCAWNSLVKDREQEADFRAKTLRRPWNLHGCALPDGEEEQLSSYEESLYLRAGEIAFVNVDMVDRGCRYESGRTSAECTQSLEFELPLSWLW